MNRVGPLCRCGIRWAAAGLGLLLIAPAAQALVSCSISATGVSFGTYSPLSTSDTVANGTVSVTCSLLSGTAINVPTNVTLSAGSSSNFGIRTLVAGGSPLNYNLFRNTAYTQIWGDGTGGSFYGVATISLSPAAPTQTVSGTMYGRIPAGQDASPGSYLDTIIVTVSY